MPKENRSGQATIITDEIYVKLTRNTPNRKWRLFFELAWHTGERYGAIRQLKNSDVFNPDGSVGEYITYRSETRKRGAGKKTETRHCWVNPTLRAILDAYPQPSGTFLFPGKTGDDPITASACDKAFREYAGQAGLINGGYSLHSFRRTFITRLAERGTGIRVIQKITGHRDVRSLMPYIEVSDTAIKNAMTAIA